MHSNHRMNSYLISWLVTEHTELVVDIQSVIQDC